MKHRALSLFLAVLPLAVHAAPPRKPVVAVLPVAAQTPELTRLGLLVEARASALLVASGALTVLDGKQVRAMASQEGLDPTRLNETAERARALLGADLVVAATLAGSEKELTLTGSLFDGQKPAELSANLSGGWAAALGPASEALAQAALARSGQTLPPGGAAQPQSLSDGALQSVATCWEAALRQPMGLDAPVGLSGPELDGAVAACRAASKADPGLRFARTTLALLLAVGREDAEAEALLGPVADTDPALTPWLLARFWLLTRHQSTEAAVAFLTRVAQRHPGVLLVRSLKAGALASMNEHARAADAWNEYLALAPSSAFARGRLSRSLARQDKLEPALAAAQEALKLSPLSREARLALAARQLDAGKLAEARATLMPLVALPNAPAEPLLHLGLAYWAAGDDKAAGPLFKQAEERAQGPKAWKTRGRALYQLALVEAKQGHQDLAQAAYKRALEVGFVPAGDDALLAKVAKAVPVPVRDAGVATTCCAAGSLYLDLPPVSGGTNPEAVTRLAESLLREKLVTLGASFAPAGEEKRSALQLIKSKGLKGFGLKVQLEPPVGTTYKITMLVTSYPEQAVKGSWSVKGAGKKPESLVKALVARVIDDAAEDLDWRG